MKNIILRKVYDSYDGFFVNNSTSSLHNINYKRILIFIVILFVLYIFFMYPDIKKKQEDIGVLKKMNIGNKVLINDSIIGFIVKIKDKYVYIKISKYTEICVKKKSITYIF